MSVPERWEELSPEMQEALLRVSRGELTADEAREQLQQGDEEQMTDSPERIDIPPRERPLMPHVHNIAGEHRGDPGPRDDETNDDED